MKIEIDYPNLGLGVNAGGPAHSLRRGEMAELTNWYPYDGMLRRRGGSTFLADTGGGAGDPDLMHFLSYKLSALRGGQWRLMIARTNDFHSWDGLSATTTPLSMGTVGLPTRYDPWSMFQYKDLVYALRRDSGRMMRIDGGTVQRSGIDRPSTPPTLSDGGAGALPTGTYRGVYTYYNLLSGMESNPSEEGVLALGANKQIDWSGVLPSLDPFVTARRLYRTVHDQTGEYFFVAQINNNVSTTFAADNVIVADLGRSVSFSNGLPPEGMYFATVWNERVFGSDGRDVFFGQILMPEMFDEEDIISVFPDDGYQVRALHAFGDRLIIGKTNKTYYLFGAGPSSFALHVLSDVHGVYSHNSMKSAESLLFWYGSGPAVYRSDGTSVREISTPRVQPYLDEVPPELTEFAHAAVFPELNWYMLALPELMEGFLIPGDPIGTNRIRFRRILVYNYRDDAWTVFEANPGADYRGPNVMGTFYGKDADEQLLVSFSTSQTVFRFNDPAASTDFQTSDIPATLLTGADPMDREGYQKFLREVWLNIAQATGQEIDIEVLLDQKTAFGTRTITLDAEGDSWKAFKLPTHGRLGNQMQFRLTYRGAPALDLQALHFVGGVTDRAPRRPR